MKFRCLAKFHAATSSVCLCSHSRRWRQKMRRWGSSPPCHSTNLKWAKDTGPTKSLQKWAQQEWLWSRSCPKSTPSGSKAQAASTLSTSRIGMGMTLWPKSKLNSLLSKMHLSVQEPHRPHLLLRKKTNRLAQIPTRQPWVKSHHHLWRRPSRQRKVKLWKSDLTLMKCCRSDQTQTPTTPTKRYSRSSKVLMPSLMTQSLSIRNRWLQSRTHCPWSTNLSPSGRNMVRVSSWMTVLRRETPRRWELFGTLKLDYLRRTFLAKLVTSRKPKLRLSRLRDSWSLSCPKDIRGTIQWRFSWTKIVLSN